MDRDTLTKFIEKYKFHTCLWNVSSPDYMNKQKRINALQDLVSILGEAATIDSVRKKIDILRNGYFRELKKVNASSTTGTSGSNVYTPTLWYYDLMSFLSSEEVSRPGTDGLDEPATAASVEEPSRITRKKRTSTKTQEELVNVAKKLLTEDKPNADQDNTFGLYLNSQLQKLKSDQRIIAEKLMSDVLFMARSNQLNATSQIITRPSSYIANTISEYSSSPIQNITSPYTEDVNSPPSPQILLPMTISKRPISQNSTHSLSSTQCVTSPYTEDVHSPPNINTSPPMMVSKRRTSQNSAHSSSSTQHTPLPYTEEVRSPPPSHTPITITRPPSQSIKPTQYSSKTQDEGLEFEWQELPNTQFSSTETEISSRAHTKDGNKSILNQLLIFKKK